MKWSRELRIARRSMRTAIKAASAMTTARVPLPVARRLAPHRVLGSPYAGGQLASVAEFGRNPGGLSMLVYLPTNTVAPGAPLIVLLHGCGQAAGRFAAETGWTALAERLGIPLILPEQLDENNRGRCFNWFRPADASRGLGEAFSIRRMVAAAVQRFESDPERVFIAGLSAGGAMAAALLAAYPDVFAAGAVVAGLPVGAASSAGEALRRMAEAGPARPPSGWADQVRHAGPIDYRGPWPRLSIWQGEADRVVDPANARLIATQWSTLHGLDQAAMETTQASGMRQERWNTGGKPVVELWCVPDLAHEWPQHATECIADFWEIATY
jgi:poly(hydroxyalkanoate) depolymerase family esterase